MTQSVWCQSTLCTSCVMFWWIKKNIYIFFFKSWQCYLNSFQWLDCYQSADAGLYVPLCAGSGPGRTTPDSRGTPGRPGPRRDTPTWWRWTRGSGACHSGWSWIPLRKNVEPVNFAFTHISLLVSKEKSLQQHQFCSLQKSNLGFSFKCWVMIILLLSLEGKKYIKSCVNIIICNMLINTITKVVKANIFRSECLFLSHFGPKKFQCTDTP